MRNDAIKNGIRPRRGMWIVDPVKRLAYGPILYVRKNTVDWASQRHPGCVVKTDHETIQRGALTYQDAPDPFPILQY